MVPGLLPQHLLAQPVPTCDCFHDTNLSSSIQRAIKGISVVNAFSSLSKLDVDFYRAKGHDKSLLLPLFTSLPKDVLGLGRLPTINLIQGQ